MAVPTRLEGDLYVTGNINSLTLSIPDGTIVDADVSASANISASKLERHQSVDVELFAEGATVVALPSRLLHITRGTTGQSLAFEGMVHTVASATTQLCYLDLQKATASTTFVSILSAPITFASSDAVRTPKAGTISNAAMTDGDVFRSVVTVTGSTANFFAGLNATLTYSERYQ